MNRTRRALQPPPLWLDTSHWPTWLAFHFLKARFGQSYETDTPVSFYLRERFTDDPHYPKPADDAELFPSQWSHWVITRPDTRRDT